MLTLRHKTGLLVRNTAIIAQCQRIISTEVWSTTSPTSSDGFLYSFSPHCGKTENQEEPPDARVINALTDIPESDYPNHKLFFDNFFTSVDTLITLIKKKMKATGTIKDAIKLLPLD